jgi:endonuclease/exonuclease/phosphatase family metal-dependent hydrolase
MVTVATWNLENLYRPGGSFGPRTQEAYDAKLAALAKTVALVEPDVLAVQEVGDPEALDDLVGLLGGVWHTRLSAFPDSRGIRVGVLSRLPVTESADILRLPDKLPPFRADDSPAVTTRMGRGALHVRVRSATGRLLDVVTCHLKSKLLTFPGGRFFPRDEGERARYGAYALYRRAAEATTIRTYANEALDGHGEDRAMVVCGDLNDETDAATTQLMLGPGGSEIGTGGEGRPDKGDAWRLWNLAPLIPADRRFSRVERGHPELIDHILVSRAILPLVEDVTSFVVDPLPSVDGNPTSRRDATDSDHAPVVARIAV